MSELREVTAAEIAKRVRSIRLDEPAAAPPDDVGKDRWEYREAATLLGSFDSQSLRPRSPVKPDTLRGFLVEDCERVTTARGNRWRLRPEVRAATLRRLGTPQRMLRTLTQEAADPVDVTRAMAAAHLAGTAPDLDRQTVAQLYGTAEAIGWLAPAGVTMPPESEVRRRLGRAMLLDPLRALAGDGFVGRGPELRRLTGYVGFHHGRVTEVLQRVLHLGEAPPLVIHGPGGVGKSTLVARFILDHADLGPDGSLPFAYLSFDRTDLVPQQPLTLLAEAVRQLALLYPAIGEKASAFETAVRASARPLLTADRQSGLAAVSAHDVAPRARRDEQKLLPRFASLVRGATQGREVPLLWLLDTFEQAQRRGAHSIDRLWGFLEELQAACPYLRIVIAGRAPLPDHPTRSLPLQGFRTETALAFLRGELHDMELSDRFLRAVVRQVSGNPLSLKLAAELLRREGDGGVHHLAGQRRALAKLSAEEVQGVLYQRILDNLDSPELRRIANPGLTVRRITPEVIKDVLAEPCGLGKIDDRRAAELFEALRSEASLVAPVPGEEAVVHRTDVRRAMLPLLSRDNGEAVAKIHRRAIRYYDAREGEANRIEELYHRLVLGQSTATLNRNWDADAGRQLDTAMDEFPEAAQAYLADKLDISIDLDTLRAADEEIWTRQAIRIARQLLDAGRPLVALAVASERRTATLHPRIRAVEIEAQAAAGRADEALRLAHEYLADEVAPSDTAALVDLLILAARVAEDAGEYDTALDWLTQARDLAAVTRDQIDALAAGTAEARLYRKTGQADTDHARTLRSWLIEAANGLSRRDRIRQPTLVRDLAAEVGDAVPDLLVDAAKLHGVEMDSAAGTVLVDELEHTTAEEFATSTSADDEGTESAAPWQEALAKQTSVEQGDTIGRYLDEAPEKIAEWASPLVKSYQAESDAPAYRQDR